MESAGRPIYHPSDFLLFKRLYFEFVGYKPHPGQVPIHFSASRFIVCICGRRWGKSYSVAREAEVTLLLPRRRVWIVAPYKDLTDKVFREVWQSLVIERRTPVRACSERERYIFLKNGSELHGKTADNPDSLVGEGLDLLIFDEAAKSRAEVWEKYLLPTLTDRKGRAVFITTPEGFNWIYDLYFLGQPQGELQVPSPKSNVQILTAVPNQKPPFSDWFSFRSPTVENPYVDPNDVERFSRLLPEETFRQEFQADFVAMSGLVYKEFDPTIHIADLEFDPELPTYRSIDFGFRNPFVCLDIQVDRNGRVYVVDEYYRQEESILDHIAYLKESKRHYLAYFCDPSGATEIELLRRAGLPVKTKPSEIRAGIEMIREALIRERRAVSGERRPEESAGSSLLNHKPEAVTHRPGDSCKAGLLISRRCNNLVSEFMSYRYPEGGRQGTSENPIKENDHALDALRYFFISYFSERDTLDAIREPYEPTSERPTRRLFRSY